MAMTPRQQFQEVEVVVLDMEVEDMVARVEARAGGDTSSADFMKVGSSWSVVTRPGGACLL